MSRLEIPVRFDGKVIFVKNITKYTTCGDVVHMLMLQSGLFVERISSYMLFEAVGDLERMLPNRIRITKRLQSWGCEKDNFSLILRKIEDDKSCLVKVQCDSMDDLRCAIKYSEEDRFNTGFLLSPVNKNTISDKYSQNANDRLLNEGELKGVSKITYTSDATNDKGGITSKQQRPKKSLKQTKASLKRYLSSFLPFQKSKRLMRKADRMSVRNNGTQMNSRRTMDFRENLVNEIKDILNDKFSSLEERCRYYWNSNSESDYESDLEDELDHFRTVELNDAFLTVITTDVNKVFATTVASFDCSNIFSGDLNEAFLNEHNDMNDSSYLSDTMNVHDGFVSDESDCELDRNITSRDVIRNVICGHLPGGAEAEDDEMDSFMRTHIFESDSEVLSD